MSMDFHFVYNAEDKTELKVKEVICRGLQDLFEFYPKGGKPEEIEQFENSVLYPEFVLDFPKLRDWASSDEDEEDDVEEYMDEDAEIYEGPLFDPQELVAWANAWIDIIQDLDEDGMRVVLPLATDGYDWSAEVLEDLKQIVKQGECAERHGIQMQIIMA